MEENIKNLQRKNYILFGVFFCLFFSLLLIVPINGNDYWWHIKVGEWIIQNKQIPRMGIYSWYALENNLPWFAHEWLAEVILYEFASLFGAEVGGLIYTLICLVLLGTILYLFNYKSYFKNLPFTLFWTVIGLISIETVCSARPHMLALCMFTFLIFICEQMKQNDSFNLSFFPILTILWANYHGGSSNITYIIPIMYFIANTFDFKLGRIQSRKIHKSWRYLALAGMNIVAILCNPRTYELLLYPYSYSDEHAKYISEWKSPSFTNGMFILLVIIIICCIFFITEKAIEFSDLALVGTFMLMSLKSLRFGVWLFLASSMIIYKYIGEHKKKDVYRSLSYVFSILGIILFYYTCYTIYTGESSIIKNVPEKVIEIIKKEEPEKLVNYYNYGCELIYEEIPVFIDGRADLYQEHNFSQSAEVLSYNQEYMPEDFMEEFDNPDMFLLPNDFFFSYWLKNNGFDSLYEDEEIVLLKKNH